MRRKTRSVMVGGVGIGSDFPISIQSMTNLPIEQVDFNVSQIAGLFENGCEIVRLAVPKPSDVLFFAKIKSELYNRGIRIPLVADVHFSPRVAYECLKIADKVRINAGNFAGKTADEKAASESFSRFFAAAKEANVPVRIGVNAGSLSDRILKNFGNSARGMWESACECLICARDVGFEDIVLSFKASDVKLMVSACRLACDEMAHLGMNYPLHLGVTEASDQQYARVKSAIGVGALLLDGIGDTIRISLTEDPKNELSVARDILQSTGARRFGPEFVACPSCGRTSYDIRSVLNKVKLLLNDCDKFVKIAIMGCVVNGLGEAGDADYAIIGLPNGKVSIYKKRTCIVPSVDQFDAPEVLRNLVKSGL